MRQRHRKSIRGQYYDELTELLEVVFEDGSLARFHRAPKYLFLGLQSARSPEKFLDQVIRPRYIKIPVHRVDTTQSNPRVWPRRSPRR